MHSLILQILLKYYLFQNKLTESVRMPPEWSSGFEVKLEKSETPSTESQDEVKLEQDENENNVGEIKNNFENQDMQRILVDEEEILKPEGNNPCRPEGEAECASFACDQCGYFSNQEAHLELHKKYKNHGVGSRMCEMCGSTFTHLKTLRKHKKRFHDEARY